MISKTFGFYVEIVIVEREIDSQNVHPQAVPHRV